MIQKLSPRRPTMEIKMKALKQIASEIGVTLLLGQDPILINKDKLNVDRRQDEPEAGKRNSADDHNHKEKIQNNPEKIIHDVHLSNPNEERKRYADTAAAAEKALESESSGIEASKHSNHRVAHGKMHVHSSSSKQEDEIILKSNHAVENKRLERRVIKKQFAWEESHSSQNTRDNVTTSRDAELISKEHVVKANGVGDLGSANSFPRDNNDHNSKSDADTENEHFSEERVRPSSHATRCNPQKSQSDTTLNPMSRRHVMDTTGPTHFPKQIHTHHEHEDLKLMSVGTR